MNEPFDVAWEAPVMTVTLNRGKANAIDAATSRALSEVFVRFRDDDDYRVAIYTGSGERFFSAGWDLNAAADGEEYEADYGPGGFGGFAELANLTKPVIMAVNGIAAGGGFEMCLAADLVVAADHAEFILPEARNGIVPDVGLVRLPRELPRALATEVLLGERRLSAPEAARLGLINASVPAQELMEAAQALANTVVRAAPLSVAAILEIVRLAPEHAPDHLLAMMRTGAVASYKRAIESADAEEGVRAFTEKREPRWSGA